MNYKDVRVGNHVLYDYPNSGWGLHELLIEDLEDLHLDCFKPIELNKEVLHALGFNDSVLNYKKHRGLDQYFSCVYAQKMELCMRGQTTAYADCKYLHQFQNLYYSLTGIELKINLPHNLVFE